MRGRDHCTPALSLLCETELQLCVRSKPHSRSLTQFEVAVVSAPPQYSVFLSLCCAGVKFQAYPCERARAVTILVEAEAQLLGFHRCNSHPETQPCPASRTPADAISTGAGGGGAQPGTPLVQISAQPRKHRFLQTFHFRLVNPLGTAGLTHRK